MRKLTYHFKIIPIFLFSILFLCVYFRISKKHLILPAPENVYSVQIVHFLNSNAGKTYNITSAKSISDLFRILEMSCSTGTQSTTDTPNQTEYSEVRIYFQNNSFHYARLYLYINGKYLIIERPFDYIYSMEAIHLNDLDNQQFVLALNGHP